MADQNDVKPVKFKPTPKSGQNIGIELKSDYILIVGSYKIKNYNF